MKTAEVRNSFQDFFRSRKHSILPSSSLIPSNDPTLFFTNAGMVQFKNIFTGLQQPAFPRAATVQKCLRVSGKHNDLENVGHTPRHHTFFEMLGNFSFGDYFKADAIEWAWTWLTEYLGIPERRLWVTVHHTDDEAHTIWTRQVGVPGERVQRLGDRDNFWSMGDQGPCGPCSEIHYDHGPGISDDTRGPAGGSERYVEIWNLVFMQYDRAPDGTLTPLPRPSIDTGAGLERLAAVLQGVFSNYQTDAFKPLMERAAQLARTSVGSSPQTDTALRVIADHARAAAFLVSDGIMPSNEERGYVLRRILRRAVRHGVETGIGDTFMAKVVDAVIDQMGSAYPELLERRSFIIDVIEAEEHRFSETLHKGLSILTRAMDQLPRKGGGVLDGDLVFKLHDTFGFPVDLTQVIAAEHGITLDMQGYREAMEKQRARGRAGWKGSGQVSIEHLHRQLADGHPSTFIGYDRDSTTSVVSALLSDGALVEELHQGSSGCLICPQTPFYAESGGQVGDRGTISGSLGGQLLVNDTTSPIPGLILHNVTVREGSIKVGEQITLQVDSDSRLDTRLNHSATHLLHSALKSILGDHVAQRGSLVSPERLRFDFSHHRQVSQEQIWQVEDLVNRVVRNNLPITTSTMPLDEARSMGAQALFGEKYGEMVRVVGVEGFSLELCGGTHANRTGDIGLFKITSESAVAAGVRRIEAYSGQAAVSWVQQGERRLRMACQILHVSANELEPQLQKLLSEKRQLEKRLASTLAESANKASDHLQNLATDIEGFQVLAAELDVDMGTLRNQAERLRDRLGINSVVLLASRQGGAVRLVATVSREIAGKKLHAGRLISDVARMVGGGGGGRPDMAQAGGKQPAKLPAALAAFPGLVRRHAGHGRGSQQP